jgi:hypothetical protein
MVRYVTVRLADGTVLALHPVSVYGTRFVAFALPVHTTVSRISAYSAHGELASAIPLNGLDGTLTTGLWLRPGQTGLPRATRRLASGTAGGRAWATTAYVGPWGECVMTRGGGATSSACDPIASPQGTRVLGSNSGPPVVVYGSASADVEHVVLTLGDGRTIRRPAIRAGVQKFFAFVLPRDQHAVRWQTYDAPGRETGSGRSGL